MFPLSIDLLAYIGPGVGFTVVGSFFILLASFVLLILSVLTWPVRLVGQILLRVRYRIVGKVNRVVVVGLDGLDPQRTRRLIDEGRLPHLQALAREGSFSATAFPPRRFRAWG